MSRRKSASQNRLVQYDSLENRCLLSGAVSHPGWSEAPITPRSAPVPSVVLVALSGGKAYAPGVTPPTQSMLTSIAVKFNVAVTVKVDALSLRNLTTGATIPFSTIKVSYNDVTHIAKWTFPSLVGGSL